MTLSLQVADIGEIIAQLGIEAEEAQRRAILAEHPELRHAESVVKLCEEVPVLAQVDLLQADRIAQAATWLAEQLDDDFCRAHSLRAAGHVCFLRGDNTRAVEHYQAAHGLFERLGDDVEVGRTLSSSLQALIYVGRYDTAFASARRAEQIFSIHQDSVRLARLQVNLGNILHRMDRFEEAVETYLRAHEVLLNNGGEPQSLATVLHNLAVCYISLDRFADALDAYQQAREHCQRHHLPSLMAQADYNIAYLYYLRGEYPRAIELYQTTRQLCDKLGDRYHKALCDLDQSEMYLDLRMSEEGSQLAQQAFAGFENLGMGYEAAKALADFAIASSRRGQPFRAIELFDKARELFVREHNRVWPSLIDLYLGIVLFQEGRYFEARRASEAAWSFFSQSSLTAKTALCEILQARVCLKLGESGAAKQKCLAALQRLERFGPSPLDSQAHFVLGQTEKALGDRVSARLAFETARGCLEDRRTRLHREELKINLLEDKLAVYESLVQEYLSPGCGAEEMKAAFSCIEQAKARALADLTAFRAHPAPPKDGIQSSLAEQLRGLREELNWYYRQIDLEEIREEGRSAQRIGKLRRRTRECEDQLVKIMREAAGTNAEFSVFEEAGTVDFAAIQSTIPAGAVLLEYYRVRDTLHLCLLDQQRLEIVPLAPVSSLRSLVRSLRLQLSRSRHHDPGPAPRLLPAIQADLEKLHAELLAPVYDVLRARHLIVAPHEFLHTVPFHALFDGSRYVIDDFSVSYVPSASLYHLCSARHKEPHRESLVLAALQPASSAVPEEVRAVAAVIPGARVCLDGQACEEGLRDFGPGSRFLHVVSSGFATGAIVPAIRLGDRSLSLPDLRQYNLSADLVALTGCGIGSQGLADELLSLEHGLLYAGAQAALLTLWDTPDASRAEFMKSFYQLLRAGNNKAVAIQRAAHEVRQAHPHPYFWAPYMLVGRFND